MPHWLRLGRVRRYEVASKDSYLICVHLLDTTLLECTLAADDTGQHCLENIAQRIQINDVSIHRNTYFFYFLHNYINTRYTFCLKHIADHTVVQSCSIKNPMDTINIVYIYIIGL